MVIYLPQGLDYFQRLGSSLVLDDFVLAGLEEFVCALYGSNLKSLNGARGKAFQRKIDRGHKVTDLATLPPCFQVFYYHALRANHIAYIWKNSTTPLYNFPPINQHGWFENGDIFWMNEMFPTDRRHTSRKLRL